MSLIHGSRRQACDGLPPAQMISDRVPAGFRPCRGIFSLDISTVRIRLEVREALTSAMATEPCVGVSGLAGRG